MTTPIADFVRKYAASDASRFHMPGHKGISVLGCEALDITEIKGADVLGAASGIIAESEANASALFGSAHSFYSTEGSTLAIKAMLALIKKKAPCGRTKILAARNVHKAFIYACALLDIDVEWLYPTEFTHLCACKIRAEELEAALKEASELPSAVYITSPDYLGNLADIKGLSAVCHSFGLPLLVDNAHGAYLAFLEGSRHPLAQGADMCCDSAHKTLPVLTGGAYLHISKGYDAPSVNRIRNAISLFASTSPSYLILQSLDMCNAYLSGDYGERLKECIEKIRRLKSRLSALGFPALSDTEELKLVFSKQACGYSGEELAAHLSKYNIEAEFADSDFLVLMVTPENTDRDLDRVLQAFSALPKKERGNTPLPETAKPKALLSIRDAVFADSEIIPCGQAEGRICASPTVSCPPAVPIVMSGELIDKATVKLLLYYGIEEIEVIKKAL